MKYLITTLLLLPVLVGCNTDSANEHTYQDKSSYFRSICIDGVIYYERYNLLAVAYNTDGTLKLCDN